MISKQNFICELSRYYRRELHLANIQVNLDWVNTQGWESEIYAYTLTHTKGGDCQTIKAVMRLLTGSSFEGAQGEFRTLSLLHQAGYPVPEVYALGSSKDGFGSPFILMQRVEGGNFSDSFPKTSQDDLAPLRKFVGLFRRLHTLDWRPYLENPAEVDSPDQPYFHFDRLMDQFSHYFNKFNLTMLEPYQDWLREQREKVPCDRGSVVHYDFHPDNILADSEGKLYVVDWTSAEISDYRFDLAWTLTLALAYGGQERHQWILDEYERQLGHPVPGLPIFEVAAILRRMGFIMLSLEKGSERMGMRPEAVEAMRRDQVPLTRLYNRITFLTGIHSPEISRWLENLG